MNPLSSACLRGVSFLLWGVLGMALLSAFPWLPWPWAMLAHGRVHFGVLLLLLGLLALGWHRLRRQGVALLLGAMLLLSCLYPYYSPSSPLSQPQAARQSLFYANLFDYSPARQAGLLKQIQASQPDAIALVEYAWPWHQHLAASPLLKAYPFRYGGKGHFGFYSKQPATFELQYAAGLKRVANHALLRISVQPQVGRAFSVALVHPPVARTARIAADKRRLVASWGDRCQGWSRPLLFVGDFNSTPWASEFQLLAQGCHLQDSQRGRGVQPSWPASLGVFALPLDQVLHSPDIKVESRQTLPSFGSDHRPVLIRFVP